jgi:hypothetical protein
MQQRERLNPSFATHCGKGAAAPVDEHPGLRKNAQMAEATTSDNWADRQRAQAAGFDAIRTHYDEVFPHKDGQVRMVEQLLERVPGRRPCTGPGLRHGCTDGSAARRRWMRGYRRRHLAGDDRSGPAQRLGGDFPAARHHRR